MDGARGHNSAKSFLNVHFSGRWIANHAIEPPIQWRPNSPDLTPLDFSLWGVLRDKVYSNAPTTLEALKQTISNELVKLPIEYFDKICTSAVVSRLEDCRRNSGQLIEPFSS